MCVDPGSAIPFETQSRRIPSLPPHPPERNEGSLSKYKIKPLSWSVTAYRNFTPSLLQAETEAGNYTLELINSKGQNLYLVAFKGKIIDTSIGVKKGQERAEGLYKEMVLSLLEEI